MSDTEVLQWTFDYTLPAMGAAELLLFGLLAGAILYVAWRVSLRRDHQGSSTTGEKPPVYDQQRNDK